MAFNQVVQVPAVGRIEGAVVQERLLALGQKIYIGGYRLDPCECLLPEVDRHFVGHVATESVHAAPDPEQHGRGHGLAHLGIGVIELGYVRPVVLHDGQSRLLVEHIPVLVSLFPPLRIARGVVGDPVDNDFQPQIMGCGDEPVERFDIAELGVDRLVVRYRVVGAERTLASVDADRVYRHQPHYVDTHLLQFGQITLGRGERAFRRRLPYVELVNHRVVLVLRHFGRIVPLGLAAAGKQCGEHGNQSYLLHGSNFILYL